MNVLVLQPRIRFRRMSLFLQIAESTHFPPLLFPRAQTRKTITVSEPGTRVWLTVASRLAPNPRVTVRLTCDVPAPAPNPKLWTRGSVPGSTQLSVGWRVASR